MSKRYFIHATLNEDAVSSAGFSVGRHEMVTRRGLKEKIKEKELEAFLRAKAKGFIEIHEIYDTTKEEDVTKEFINNDSPPLEVAEPESAEDLIITSAKMIAEEPKTEVQKEAEEESKESKLDRIAETAVFNPNEDGRVPCPYCTKTYANTSSSITAFKDHILKHHAENIA